MLAPNREDILKTWKIFRLPGEALEVRIPKARKFKTISGYFDDQNSFVDAVVGLASRENDGFIGHYFTINPVKRDLLARSNNRVKSFVEITTSDADVLALHWLPIDIDAKRPAGISSTDKEHEMAISKSTEIQRWLIDENGWPANAFVLADSGNGGHLCIRIELDLKDKHIVEKIIKKLDILFSNEIVHVDTSTFNPARIWKIYGTPCQKGDNVPERPHRLAKLLEVPGNIESVSKDKLEALAGIETPAEDIKLGVFEQMDRDSVFDVVKYVESHGHVIVKSKRTGEYTTYILDVCPFNSDHIDKSAMISQHSSGKLSFKCQHNGCEGKYWKDLRELWEPERKYKDISVSIDQAMQAIDMELLTEGGNASRLERICGEEMRFCHTIKKWLVWVDGYWKTDNNGMARRKAEGIVRVLYAKAANTDGKDARNKITRFAEETDSRRGINNMLDIASSRSTFAITNEILDTDDWLLGAGKITINLKTLECYESRQTDMITKRIGTTFDKDAKCPLWEKFVAKIFGNDIELIEYVQRAIGYSLTGSIAEQVFFFCHGSGANGKSTLITVLRNLMGSYAKQAEFSTFLLQRAEKVRNDLAALAGARMIAAVEAEEGSKLSMQVIKSWTGGDLITARFLFGENFTFKPIGKLWLVANNKPVISERNHAAWRRVQLIPFNVTISESEKDKDLDIKLLAELPGILNWALEGLREYMKKGLSAPSAVKIATEEYREENDSMRSFLSECCEIQKHAVCRNADLYGAYYVFCGMSEFKPLTQTKFSTELKKVQDVSSVRDKYGMTWMGIGLKSDWCRVEKTDETTTDGNIQAYTDVGMKSNEQKNTSSARIEKVSANDYTPTYPTPITKTDETANSNPTPKKEQKKDSDEGQHHKDLVPVRFLVNYNQYKIDEVASMPGGIARELEGMQMVTIINGGMKK
ncbi:phage/plasmid primase, P4 family [Candidatus Pacearchaeota archaeon]|jgi:putative DNA primase/helicase|nr:phage/plasmid primase, P4 family [Candidatus Pacearchaeota archaeon]